LPHERIPEGLSQALKGSTIGRQAKAAEGELSMFDFMHGIILSLICSTGFLSVFHLMEISRNLKVLNQLTAQNNAILRSIVTQASRRNEQLESLD
jgi:hypothetical protein